MQQKGDLNMTEAPTRILLVEDEPEVRMIAEGILASSGYAVTAAANGAEALASMDAVRPDLILSDIRMPVVDGFQLLQKIRADPVWHQTPFIILSARAESADLRMGMSLGADDYVTKPYRAQDILKTIEIRVQRARQVSEAIAGNRRFLTRVLPHELRTPLMGVIGYADLMVDTANEGKTLTPAELAEYGRMLQMSGARIFRIVENLLFWSRLERPRDAPGGTGSPWRVDEVVNAGVLRDVGSGVAAQFGRAQDLVVECPVGATVQVVTTGFEFVAHHLLENAFKCSLPNSSVKIAAAKEAKVLRVSVSDSGRGMTPQQIEWIGNFKKLSGVGSEGHGLGMGLMLASTFARASGGQFAVKAGPGGRGIEVTMSLPLAPDAAAN